MFPAIEGDLYPGEYHNLLVLDFQTHGVGHGFHIRKTLFRPGQKISPSVTVFKMKSADAGDDWRVVIPDGLEIEAVRLKGPLV